MTAIEYRVAALLEDELSTHLKCVSWQAQTNYEELAANCESPMEQLLLVPLMFIKPQCVAPRYEGPGDYGREAHLYTQYKVGDRRLDFAYIVHPIQQEQWTISVGIEVDGHAYHSTPAQKANDNSRTREIVRSEDFNVIRFTGAEVNADPRKCAWEVADIVDGIYADKVFKFLSRTRGKPYIGPAGPLFADIVRRAGEGEQ
jgi:very-short-patch-repair endonuclease